MGTLSAGGFVSISASPNQEIIGYGSATVLLRFANGENDTINLGKDATTEYQWDIPYSTNIAGIDIWCVSGSLNYASKAVDATLADATGQSTTLLAVLGQSNERGQVAYSDLVNYPRCFSSLLRPAIKTPVYPAVAIQTGSWWPKVVDSIVAAGYNVNLVNGAIGSLSFIKHTAGQIDYWNANSHYRNARASIGNGDYGDVGSLLVQSNKMFQLQSGGDNVYVSYSGGIPIPGSSPAVTELDYVYTIAGGASGGTLPAGFATATLGQTVTDGGLTWKCIDANVSGSADGSINGATSGKVLFKGNYGFDPLGVLRRLKTACAPFQNVKNKILCLSNGQSDLFAMGQTWYFNALLSITDWAINNGFYVAIGFTCFTPTSDTAHYNDLQNQKNAAISNFSSNPLVFAGGDLYASLGATSGSNGLILQGDQVHLAGAGAYAAEPPWSAPLINKLATI